MATTSPHASNGHTTFTPNTIGRTWPVTATWSFSDPIEWITFAFTAPDKTVKTIGLDLADIGLWCETFTGEEMGFLSWVTSNHDNGATIALYAQSINLIRSINGKVGERLQASVTTTPTVPMGAKIEPQPAPVKVSVPLAQRIAEAAREDSAPIVPVTPPAPVKVNATAGMVSNAVKMIDVITSHTGANGDVDAELNQASNVIAKLGTEAYSTFSYDIPDELIAVEGDSSATVSRVMKGRRLKRRVTGCYDSTNDPCPNPSSFLWRVGMIRVNKSVWWCKTSTLARSDVQSLMTHWNKYRKQGLWFFAYGIDQGDCQVIRDEAKRRYEMRCSELGQSLILCISAADNKLAEAIKAEGITSKEMENAESVRHNAVRARLKKLSDELDEMIACHAAFDETMDTADAIKGLRVLYTQQRELFNQVMAEKGNYRKQV